MNEKLRKLLAALEANKTAAEALNAKADDDGLLAEADQKAFDDIAAKMAVQVKSIAQERIMLDAASSLGDAAVVADAHGGGGRSIIVGDNKAKLDPTLGFANMGDFASAVVMAQSGRGLDERLSVGAALPGTSNVEKVGVDGGYLVPPSMSEEIFRLMLEEDSFIPLTSQGVTEGNSQKYRNLGEVTPWGSTGVQAYWVEEGAAIPLSKMKAGSDELKLHDLAALVPVSGQMMEDVSGLSSFLTQEASEAMRWVANEAIINGDGTGKPQGLTQSGALVVQAKVASQTADTINATNIANMFGRWHTRTPGQRVLINPDAFAQIILLTLGDRAIWTPPQEGFKDAPDGFLMGRPLLKTDHAETLGDQNDIMMVDFGFYRTLGKVGGGIRTDMSIHLYFDSNHNAFRFIFRIAGQSKMSGPIVPPKGAGANTRSPFVTLAVRS